MKRYREIVFSVTAPEDRNVIWVFPVLKSIDNDLIDKNLPVENFKEPIYKVLIWGADGWENLFHGALTYVRSQVMSLIQANAIKIAELDNQINQENGLKDQIQENQNNITTLQDTIYNEETGLVQKVNTLNTEIYGDGTIENPGLIEKVERIPDAMIIQGIETSEEAIRNKPNPSVGDVYLLKHEDDPQNIYYEEYVYTNNQEWVNMGLVNNLTNYYTKSEVNSLLNAKSDIIRVYLENPREIAGNFWSFIFPDSANHSSMYELRQLKQPIYFNRTAQLYANASTQGSSYLHYSTGLFLGGYYPEGNTDIDGFIALHDKITRKTQFLKPKTSIQIASIPSVSTSLINYICTAESPLEEHQFLKIVRRDTVIFEGESNASYDRFSNSIQASIIINNTNVGTIRYYTASNTLYISGQAQYLANVTIYKFYNAGFNQVLYLPTLTSEEESHQLATTEPATTERNGLMTKEDKSKLNNIDSNGSIPIGGIIMWSGNEADIDETHWALCDGQNGTPDLRDRFIVGAGNEYSIGDKGGQKKVTLEPEETALRSHAHKVQVRTIDARLGGSGYSTYVVDSSETNWKDTTTVSGQNALKAHENRPPYYALAFIMRIA